MTDDSSILPNTTTSTTADPHPTAQQAIDTQKNPLDILEQLLADSKSGAQAPATPVPDKVVQSPPAPEPPGPTPEELAQMEADRAAQDQAAAQAKLDEIQSVQTTPEYQVRVQQDQAAAQEQSQAITAQAGFEITQLDHIKIPS